MPLGLAMNQGHANGPAFPVRLEPYTSATWLIRPEPFLETLRAQGRSGDVKATTTVNGQKITSKQSVDLDLIAKYNE